MTETNTASLPTAARPSRSRDIPCIDPATREPLGTVRADTPEDVVRKVARAREAQKVFRETSFETRRQLLTNILENILNNIDELVTLCVRDAGKTRENALMGEVWPVCEKLRWTIGAGEDHLLPETMSSGLFMHKKATVHFEPKGVIGVICPWNYPLQNILGPVIPALFAGNAAVVKVSEQVAWSSERFARIFDEALDALGLPRELVTLVNGYGDVGKALVESGVDLVVFTGSGPNGQKVIEASAKNITPVILELGGKDPLIVCDDADLEQAAHAAMAGCFIAAGQNCMAAERVIVHDGIYDRYVARMVELVGSLRQGPPLGETQVDVGAMVSPMQVDIVERLVDDAIAKGAKALVGGTRVLEDQGQYFAPTVLVDVTDDMLIMREETFGPVMVIAKVTSDQEAIHLANSTSFGLGSTVLSKDHKRARWIADQLVAGSTTINDFGLTYMAQALPFGGVGASGFGRLNGREGLRACTNVKAVLSDRLPLHMPTKIYPVGESDYTVVRGLIETIYRPTVRGRVAGVARLLSGVKKRFS